MSDPTIVPPTDDSDSVLKIIIMRRMYIELYNRNWT